MAEVEVEVESGVRILVRDDGAGDAVVLVPGFGMTGDVWNRQAELLASRHRVVRVDQRGHGGSDKPAAGYEVDRLATDLLAVLDRLGITRCTLVGWSFGGQVAFRLAAREPERITRLVLVGSNGVRAGRSDRFPFGRDPGPTEAALVAAERADRPAARRQTIASGFHRPPSGETLRGLVERSLRMPTPVAVACYHAMLHTDLVDDIDRVTMPVLQVVGAQDPVHSAKGARWLNERLADATLVEIPDCGHYPMIEAPDAFDAALTGFLDASA